MSSTTTRATKAETLAQLQTLITGLQKQLPSGQFTLVSTAYTTATLVTALQGLVTALTAVNNAQASVKAALVAWHAEEAKTGPVVQALKRVLEAMYVNAPDTLALFGLKPPKARTPLTATQRAAAVAKADATRKARGTTSKKQKAAVTGNVTGVTITPIVAPVAAPPAATPVATAQQPAPQPVAVPPQPVAAQPVASQPATQPATPAPAVSNGHSGQ